MTKEAVILEVKITPLEELSVEEIINKLKNLVPELLPLSNRERCELPNLNNIEALKQTGNVLVLCNRLSAKIMAKEQKKNVISVLAELSRKSTKCEPVHDKLLSLKKELSRKNRY